MSPLFFVLLGGAAIAASVELVLLVRLRRLMLSDNGRQGLLLQVVARPPAGMARHVAPPPASAAAAPTAGSEPAWKQAGPEAAPAADREGILYIDASGRCTFANQAARHLLHWHSGELCLEAVLAGGRREATALLEALAESGQISQHTLVSARHIPVSIFAVALRDRDDQVWGAALFLHPAGERSLP